jgi:formamidopyrimidine-DNA glycosylase
VRDVSHRASIGRVTGGDEECAGRQPYGWAVPELPEVRAHAERISGWLGGNTVRRVEPLSFTALKTAVPAIDAVKGRALDRVDQRGKYLLMRFGDLSAVTHLMQGGRLRLDEKQARRPRGGLVRWVFEDGQALLLTEAGTEKRAGVWMIEGETEGVEPLAHLGPEADSIGAEELLERLHAGSRRLHGWLRHQGNVAGIGRRLANEVCYRAALSPFAGTAKLTAEDAERLVAAMRESVEEGLEFERGLADMSASKDRPGSVHNREGEPCGDGDTIRTVQYRSYTIYYCPERQTGGKILADNTTSKFLK